MAELLKEYEPEIQSFTIVPSDGGRFEVKVDGRLIYSKLQTGRHVKPGEIAGLIQEYLREGR